MHLMFFSWLTNKWVVNRILTSLRVYVGSGVCCSGQVIRLVSSMFAVFKSIDVAILL